MAADWETQRVVRAHHVSLLLLTALALVTLGWLPFSSVSVAPVPFVLPMVIGTVLTIAARYYGRIRHETRLANALDCTAQMLVFMALGSLLSYQMATLGFPLQDDALHAADRALGLDWLSYLKAVDARPWLGAVFSVAYASFIPQAIILIIALSFSGESVRIRIVILAMMISGILTIVLSGFLPAMAMFVHLGLTPADYPNLQPGASFVHVADMMGLRSGAPFLFDLSRAEGIITFPSYHAALGMLLLIGPAHHRWLRWPYWMVNLTMIASTPIDGGHYFVDVAAGLVIALACYGLARRIVIGRHSAPYRQARDATGIVPAAS